VSCDRFAALERLRGELVELRGARAVAGEQERDGPEKVGVGRQVVAGEVVLLGDRLAPPGFRSGPVLAQEGALVTQLQRMILGEAHAVAGGEQQRRRGAAEQPRERLVCGRLAGDLFDRPAGQLWDLRQQVGERGDQRGRARLGRVVVGVGDREERQPAVEREGLRLGSDDAAGVMRVLLDGVEADPPDRILDADLRLEAERDLLRVADEQQVIGHLLRIRRARAGAVAREELLLALAGAHAGDPGVLLIVALDGPAGDAASVGQQRRKGLADRRLPFCRR
jgi:hypothetical protein